MSKAHIFLIGIVLWILFMFGIWLSIVHPVKAAVEFRARYDETYKGALPWLQEQDKPESTTHRLERLGYEYHKRNGDGE